MHLSRAIYYLAVLNGLAAFVLGAWRLQKPDGFWAEREAWVLAALTIAGATPFLQAFIAERGERTRRRAVERERKLESFLVSALIDLVNLGRADWQRTGVQMFLVRGRWWWSRQERVARVRLAPRPSSGVVWSKGKGVVGRVWETRRGHVVNAVEHFAPFAGFEEARFLALSPERRYGLSFDDFNRLKGKYGVVAGVPIVDRKDRYVGCLTADLPPDLPQAALDASALLRSLEVTAHLVRDVL